MKRLVQPDRIDVLQEAARQMPSGTSYVECGTYRGWSASKVGSVLAGRCQMWLFDSFSGLPVPSDKDIATRDGRQLGEASSMPHYGMPEKADHLDVTRTMHRLVRSKVNLKTVFIVPGWFQDTFPAVEARITHIGLLFIDCDWYESVKLSLDTWSRKVISDGMIVLDDYGAWQGCKTAADEWLAANDEWEQFHVIDRCGVWTRRKS